MRRMPRVSPQQNLIVGAAVRAVADETMEDALARAIVVRAGRRPDSERLLFAIVDGLEDYKLTAPAFAATALIGTGATSGEGTPERALIAQPNKPSAYII